MNTKPKATATNGEATPSLVPKLRFPEFLDAGEWKSTRLGDLCEVITKGSTPTSYGYDFVDSGVRFVKIESLRGGSVDCSKTAYITEECNSSFFRSQLKENDILFSIAGALGVVALVDHKILPANVNQAIGIVRLKRGYLHQFLLHQLQGVRIQAEIQRIRAGAAQPNISLSQLGDFAALLPTKAEQQKIASCLSSLDNLITAHTQKLNALKTYKKGLMQQLFPREGETVPRLRFPEFQSASEWEETELGRVVTIKGRIGYRGYTVEDIVDPGDGAISLSPSNITEAGVMGFDKVTYISWAKYLESPEIMVERGQTLLVKTGSTFGKVAYVTSLPHQCTVNPQIVVLKPKSIHPYFLFLTFLGELIQAKIRAIVVGGAIPTLSQESVSKFKVRVPVSAEQQHIADCLAKLDGIIAAQTQKIECLKAHKKGLMQGLFPAVEGVTV